VVVLLLPSLVWAFKDRTVWPWDQAWYGQVSVELWYWLGHSWHWWLRVMAGPTKPPGIVWLGQFFVPLGGVLGSIETALLISILLTQFVMLTILFKIAQIMAPKSRLVPLTAVCVAGGSQLFVGLSHQFLVEPLQALAVTWCFYIALRCDDWPKARIAVHLVAALVLGALAKATTPLYCLMPSAYCGYQLLRTPWNFDFATEWKSLSSRALLLALGPMGVACGLWYVLNLRTVWQHVQESSSGDVALNYGTRDTVFNKLIVWSRIFSQSFLDPYLSWGCLAAILLVIAVAVAMTVGSKERLRIAPVTVLSITQTALLLFVFSLNIAVDSRYMYALLPGIVIVTTQVLVHLPRIALIGFMMLAVGQWALVSAISLNMASHLTSESDWLLPLRTDASEYEELGRVVYVTSEEKSSYYNVVGVEYPWLNANSASFFAAKEQLRSGRHSYYTSLGYAEKDVDKAIRRIEALQTFYGVLPLRYLITVAEPYQSREPNFVNIVSLPVLEQIRQDSRFAQYPFPSKKGVLLFRFTHSSVR
jgi:hypothetical protein